MNWDDFRFVLAIARKGTLTKAAQSLEVNQTTVTRRLQALQEQLGVQLFEKLKHGFVPTQAGEDVIRVAEEIEQKVFVLDDKVLGRDSELTGSLRVTFSEFIGSQWLWAFHRFAELYPEIELELSLTNINMNLTQREADVAIRQGNPPENLIGRKLARVEYALYAAKSLLETYGENLNYSEYPWMVWERSLRARLTEAWMAKHARNAKTVYAVNSLILMKESVRQGLGIAFLPCAIGDASPEFVRLRPVEEGFGVDLWLLTHPDLRNIARVRAFLDYIADIFYQHRDLFTGQSVP